VVYFLGHLVHNSHNFITAYVNCRPNYDISNISGDDNDDANNGILPEIYAVHLFRKQAVRLASVHSTGWDRYGGTRTTWWTVARGRRQQGGRFGSRLAACKTSLAYTSSGGHCSHGSVSSGECPGPLVRARWGPWSRSRLTKHIIITFVRKYHLIVHRKHRIFQRRRASQDFKGRRIKVTVGTNFSLIQRSRLTKTLVAFQSALDDTIGKEERVSIGWQKKIGHDEDGWDDPDGKDGETGST